MREIERSRFVPTRPDELLGAVDPARIVEYEGSFSVDSIERIEEDGQEGTAGGEATLVTVSGPGIAFTLRFEPLDRGYYYTQAGEAGPFEAMETWLTVDPEDEGSRVTVRSAVSIGLPLPLSDRLAAWKRNGEVERALDRLAADV
jgi:hypothetical protein